MAPLALNDLQNRVIMQKVNNVLEHDDFNAFLVAGVSLLLLSGAYYCDLRRRDISVPAVGPSGRLTSYYGAFKYVTNARAMLEEGYAKYKGATFKIPRMTYWQVVVSKPELIEEVRKAPDDKLSISAAFDETLQIKHTSGHYVYIDRFHEDVIRSRLTANINHIFEDVKDEITEAFSDIVDIEMYESEWRGFPALHTIMQIVCRTSNRVFVGLPLCRNMDYINLNIQFTKYAVESARLLQLYPAFLRGIAARLFTRTPETIRRAYTLTRPLIESRLKQYELFGDDWPGKPNDMLSWLMDEARGEQRTVEALAQRMLSINFVAIHTSSMSFTHALFHLAARPEYIEPIREEVESVIGSDGWTKAAMQKMKKLDSFFKESQRFDGISLMPMERKAVVDYTLSDGTFLPKGSFVGCYALAAHRYETCYDNPHEFDGFRFANIRADAEGESAKHQFAATSIEYIPFGHGKHACPGRFFAANELKCVMAYLVLNYDFKLENSSSGRPMNLELGTTVIPNPRAAIMLRKRQWS